MYGIWPCKYVIQGVNYISRLCDEPENVTLVWILVPNLSLKNFHIKDKNNSVLSSLRYFTWSNLGLKFPPSGMILILILHYSSLPSRAPRASCVLDPQWGTFEQRCWSEDKPQQDHLGHSPGEPDSCWTLHLPHWEWCRLSSVYLWCHCQE